MASCIIPNCKYKETVPRLSLHLFPDPAREPERHIRWIRLINNEKVLDKDPKVVFKQLRVCRGHFEASSFNGSCKKLLNSAIPSLNLLASSSAKFKEKLQTYEKRIAGILQENSIELKTDSFQLPEESHVIELPKTNDEEEYELMEVEDGGNFTIVLKTEPLMIQKTLQATFMPSKKRKAPNKTLPPLSTKHLMKLRKEFYNCPKRELAQNICTRVDPLEAAISRCKMESTQHVFQYKVDIDVKPMTDQKSSGRCWNFAVLNAMRIPFMKQYNLEEFEFSQAYFFYWDKIERSYFFLNNIVETAKRGEDIEGRLMTFLLSDPTCDGGQWDLAVSIINKHGVMPKKCFPESFSSESSARMNAILKTKLREYAKILRDLHSTSASYVDIQAKVNEQMGEIYNIVGICLGIPPVSFTWEYYDKNKKYNSVGPVTALDFYESFVKTYFNVDDKVVLFSDPRPNKEFNRGYIVECFGNVVGDQPMFFNNQPIEILIDLVTKSLKKGEPVWFGCDVKKRFTLKSGIEDMDIVNYKLLFDVECEIGLNKADRILYGDSALTHAMVFTGVSLDKKGNPAKFRVENSWGDEKCGEKGFLVMTAEWFREFGFEIVVDKQHVPEEVMDVFDTEPIVLPAWDPMASIKNDFDY